MIAIATAIFKQATASVSGPVKYQKREFGFIRFI